MFNAIVIILYNISYIINNNMCDILKQKLFLRHTFIDVARKLLYKNIIKLFRKKLIYIVFELRLFFSI